MNPFCPYTSKGGIRASDPDGMLVNRCGRCTSVGGTAAALPRRLEPEVGMQETLLAKWHTMW